MLVTTVRNCRDEMGLKEKYQISTSIKIQTEKVRHVEQLDASDIQG